ncbi:MAG: tetratricopeptide repeat protein [Okeania sp. SIO2F4]|uniref:tetratricopeptide repeat protein n=1 Tax=Okeania sp. SIO2F4 TaxID=2607790 RepID=UPI0014291225|nr:tetratricopeptide repeat protein [Okeania sp. SIO2F4]NES03617.1 tetratricopeptide repeat protein [Okeania sp. SIO2F4]
MAKNRLVINHVGDTIQLSWQRGQANPRFAPSVTFHQPFDEQALTDLRWYLEEYLAFPYGIFPDKAQNIIEPKLQEWGQQLFELVFRSNEKTREFFQEATRERLEFCEIAISSEDPVVLNLPWELLYSPDYQFLAPSLAGMYRSLSNFAVRAEMPAMPQDKLNILLVIARPYDRDVGFQTIARPMLEVLQPIRQQVNLKVLRPPSFEQLERELNAQKGFYHIVHFDGHGNFDSKSQGFQHSFGSKGQGVLVFEKDDGTPDIVTAAQIAQSLNDCNVPIFVLNACKSAQEGGGSFSSVATRLVSLGAKGVVAMGYSVYAEGAKHFIGRLYQDLVNGASLDGAVASGRREMLNKRERPTVKGNLPLADWMVPVLYQQENYTPFVATTTDAEDIPDLDDFLEEPKITNLVDLPEPGAYGFVGRSYDILRLERGFRQNNIVLLQGVGGVGKTELVCGFARWLADTQGRAGKIIFSSFESGAGLSQVVNQVGRAVWGDKFSQYAFDKQQAAVLKYLQTQPCLLIWDNFEPVAGFPAGNEGLLPEAEREELKDFLQKLRNGKTWVLITSRREERWLECGYRLLKLEGLSQSDAQEFAGKILEQVGVDRKGLPEEYLELLKLLDGHPLSLRVVLPHLKTETPQQLIDGLRQGLDRLKDTEGEGRDKSLTVSLDYSFERLSDRARQHLPFLGFFSGRVDAEWLGIFSGNRDGENGKAYQAVFGNNLQESDWLKILNEAVEAGIIEYLGETYYEIHPTLPWYLRQRLGKNYAQAIIEKMEKRLLFFYADLANYYQQQLIGNAKLATFVLQFEEPNLLQNLRLAEQQEEWAKAQLVLQALGELYKRQVRKPELRSLQQRAVKQLGRELTEANPKGKDAFNFWIYLRGGDANQALDVADWKGAKALYQEILDELIALKDSSANGRIAAAYHHLGMVAQEQRQFNEAIKNFQEAMQIFENTGDFYNVADEYHHLGMVAREQRQFDEAIKNFQEAIQIFENAGDFYNAAREYHQLGRVAQEQCLFSEAIKHFRQALQIRKYVEDFYNAAYDFHQLGIVAQKQRYFTKAIAYFQGAMQIYEDSGDFYKAAGEYHQLGRVAHEQRQFDEATAYFQKAFAVFHAAKDWYRVSITLNQLGKTLEAQANWTETMKIRIQALEIDLEHNKQLVRRNIIAFGRILKVLGEDEFSKIWKQVAGNNSPEEFFSALCAEGEQS